MGGGNAQKSATARARNLEKAGEGKVCFSKTFFLKIFFISLMFVQNAGGGAKGKEARTGGNMAAAMAEAQGVFHFLWSTSFLMQLIIYLAKRDAVIKKRAEGIKDAAPNPKK